MAYEIEKYLYLKLQLKEYLSEEELITFFTSIMNYLKHTKSEELKGRTYETFKKNIDELYNFLKAINCTDKEIINIISSSPDMLNTEIHKLYNKYLILGILDNCNKDPEYRKKMIINKPRDFRTSIETLYARYDFANSVGYPYKNITWSILMHDTNKEFIKKFVKSKYNKSYKIFKDENEVTAEMLIEKFPLDLDVIENLKNLETNKEVVMKFEGKEKEQEPSRRM